MKGPVGPFFLGWGSSGTSSRTFSPNCPYNQDAKPDPDGTKKSVGVVLPATLCFGTNTAEVMECVAGSCEYKLAGSADWAHCGPGEQFSVPGNSQFDIRVSDTFHYICHYG